MTRTLRVGDIVIYNHRSFDPHIGVINKIECDRYGHQHNVFVHWQGKQPRNYNADVGYSGMNILNLRHEYRVIRH